MRKFVSGLSTAALIAASTPALAQEEKVFQPGEHTVEGTIDGERVRIEIAPDAPNSPVLAPETAQRLGLKGSMIQGIHLVGRTKIKAQSNRIKIDFGDGERKTRRAFFFDGEWHGAGEALINPASLNEPVVTYRLREQAAGEATISLPLLHQDIAGYYTELVLGEERVPTFFTFARGETMATAATGALLAQAFGGAMAGESRAMDIEFGIERPVRAMSFTGTPMLGQLPLANIVVRTQDTGSTADIPDDERDPNEIVVTGGKGKPLKRLWIGTDTLAACSSLTFDSVAEEIRLSCAAS